MAPSQNADDGNCPDCHKSLAANRGHLENILYNQMSPVFYHQCFTPARLATKDSQPRHFSLVLMLKPQSKSKGRAPR